MRATALARSTSADEIVEFDLAGVEKDRTMDRKQFELAVKIAALILCPVNFIDESYCSIGPLGPGAVQSMAEHTAFRRPINRAVADTLKFTTVPIGAEMMMRISTSALSQLSILIVTAPTDILEQLAAELAAASLSKLVRSMILKADRDLARNVLGTEGFRIATNEAPLLSPRLCEIAKEPMGLEVLRNVDPADTSGDSLKAFGFCILGRFLDATESALSEFFSRRMSPNANYFNRDQYVKPLEIDHCEQVLKFVHRRQRSWSATIG